MAVLEDATLEPLAVMRVHDDPKLRCAGMEVVERVEQAILDVQSKWRRSAASIGDIKIGSIDAGVLRG
jgi:hypothetical protein